MDSWESKGTLPPPPVEKGPNKVSFIIPHVIKGLPLDSHRFALLVTERTEGSELLGKREREQLPLARFLEKHILGTVTRLTGGSLRTSDWTGSLGPPWIVFFFYREG